MRVLITDSSIHVSQRLKEMLSELNFIESVYTTDSYSIAREIFTGFQPGIVLLGINIPENDSLKLLAEITHSSFITVVIVLFFPGNKYINEQCIKLGESYFLVKYEDF